MVGVGNGLVRKGGDGWGKVRRVGDTQNGDAEE